jgi:hypothetical protein
MSIFHVTVQNRLRFSVRKKVTTESQKLKWLLKLKLQIEAKTNGKI